MRTLDHKTNTVKIPLMEKPDNTNRIVTVITAGTSYPGLASKFETLRLFDASDNFVLSDIKNLVVWSRDTELSSVSKIIHHSVERHLLRALLIESISGEEWLAHMMHEAKVKSLQRTLVHPKIDPPLRIFSAWAHGEQHNLIAAATIAGGLLYIRLCDMKVIKIPVASFNALTSLSEDELTNFQVSPSGRNIRWLSADIVIDVDAILSHEYPVVAARSKQQSETYNKAFGQAVAKLREASGILQKNIEGLSDRQVRRIEGGEQLTVNAIRTLAKAHDLQPNEYMAKLATLVNRDCPELAKVLTGY